MKKRILIILILTATLINPVIWLDKTAADSDGYFILCHPESFLNARFSPSKRGSLIGSLYCGDYVETDRQKKGGYVHCTNLTFETNEGWIYTGYLVETEPVVEEYKATVIANGRVACRNRIGGKRVRWVKPGAEVTVFAHTDEWCVTNKGYIQAKYLRASTETTE